jgi:hypothetical protein
VATMRDEQWHYLFRAWLPVFVVSLFPVALVVVL